MQDQDTKPFLSIPNWDEMQHYKDRSPPWIKLQNELLENYEFERLHDASKAHLLCIWLLASRTGNKINPDPKWIGRKIGANSKVDVDALVKSGFLQLNQPLPSVEHDASKALQTSEQDAIPEGEGEGEGEESRAEVEPLPSKLDAVGDVINYLNFKTGSNYQSVESNGKLIRARINEGRTVDEIKAVVDYKCIEWPEGHDCRKYLRPATLFNSEKFNQYFGQLGQPINLEQQNGQQSKSAYQQRTEAGDERSFNIDTDF